MTTSPLCFIDTETTGLDSRIHQPYEVSWWRETATGPETWNLPHSLDHADGGALRIGGYFDRGLAPFGGENERRAIASRLTAEGDVRATRAVYMALDGLRDAR